MGSVKYVENLADTIIAKTTGQGSGRSQIQLCRGCGRERERQRILKQAKIEKQLEPKPPSPTRDSDYSPNWRSARPENHCMRDNEFCFGLRD